MKAVPIHISQAGAFIREHHRHSLPPVGGKFAIGVADDEGHLLGVAVCGRPVARRLDDGHTLEILRVCTTGTPNVNSFLYARARKIARLLGYERVITYTLQSESGASLRAAGACATATVAAGPWSRPSRPRAGQPVYTAPKVRWEF